MIHSPPDLQILGLGKMEYKLLPKGPKCKEKQ